MSQQDTDILIVMVAGTVSFLILTTFFIALMYRYNKRMRHKQLELFNAVIEAQEKEQERIARDLHDQIGPSLSIIKTQIESIDDSGLGEIDRKIRDETTQQLTAATNEVRSIAHNLIPKTYTEYGFIKSLEYYTIRLEEYARLSVTFTCPHWPPGIEKAYEISIYRIMQELFQNTLRHSGATRVTLDIGVKGRTLEIRYSDNGKGVPSGQTQNKGIGFQNIDSRVKLLGGSFTSGNLENSGLAYNFTFNMDRLYGKR